MSSLDDLFVEGRILGKSNVDLTPEAVCVLGAVHGTYMENNGIIVIGRDYRRDSRMLKRAFTSGAMSTGIDILDLHVAPLPLVQFCIRRFGASGGVYITSGHLRYEDLSIRIFNPLSFRIDTGYLMNFVSERVWRQTAFS